MAMAAHRQHRPPIHSPNPTKENRYEKVCKHRDVYKRQMLACVKLSQKATWLKEYGLGIAIVAGIIVGALVR